MFLLPERKTVATSIDSEHEQWTISTWLWFNSIIYRSHICAQPCISPSKLNLVYLNNCNCECMERKITEKSFPYNQITRSCLILYWIWIGFRLNWKLILIDFMDCLSVLDMSYSNLKTVKSLCRWDQSQRWMRHGVWCTMKQQVNLICNSSDKGKNYLFWCVYSP